ncbi:MULTISPECIES: hypothetical protein [Brenneria]|nr:MULTISPECIES: hypothetical protein [Brenneria]
MQLLLSQGAGGDVKDRVKKVFTSNRPHLRNNFNMLIITSAISYHKA